MDHVYTQNVCEAWLIQTEVTPRGRAENQAT